MYQSNMKNNGLDHSRPVPVNKTNNGNGGNNNNSPYNGYSQIYTGIPQGISMDMGGNQEQMKSMSAPSSQSYVSGCPVPSGGMGSFQNLPQMQPQQPGLQQMNFAAGQQMAPRPWNSPGPMGGGYPMPSMYPYPPMQYPVYPPSPYGGGGGMWGSSPTNIPVDGYVTDFGGDFKILGYSSGLPPEANQNANMNPQNPGSNFGLGGNSRMGNEKSFNKY